MLIKYIMLPSDTSVFMYNVIRTPVVVDELRNSRISEKDLGGGGHQYGPFNF